MNMKTHTFLLHELARLESFMNKNQDDRITFEDKIKDWPRSEVEELLSKYKNLKNSDPLRGELTPLARKHFG